ncbi:LysR family transcriptional regulator [Bradyrhizobium sp. USDA 10063]
MPHDLAGSAAPMQRKKLEDALRPAWGDLRVFLLCARNRSFSRAADVLGVPATAMMRKIDKLEDDLGCKLFSRDEAQLTLTGEGRALLFDVEQMERLSLNIARRARAPAEVSGTVRIAVTEGPGNFWVLPRLITFERTYRNIIVELRCVSGCAEVPRQEADISLQIERPNDPELIATKIGRLHIYAFASKAYRDAYGLPASLDELKHHRIVKQDGVPHGDGTYKRILGVDSLEGIVGISTNSSVAVLYAVEQGAGIGFLPSSVIALGAPLVAVDLGVNHQLDLWLCYHRQFRQSDRHRLMIEWLKSIFDPKVYACFRDEFIHPDELTPLMVGSREHFGLQNYVAPKPFPIEATTT